MKLLLIIPILLYRVLIPPRYRRHCLFRQSCSLFVLESAKHGGLRSGIRALKVRIRQCRGGYQLAGTEDGKLIFIACDGAVIDQALLAPNFVAGINQSMCDAARNLSSVSDRALVSETFDARSVARFADL